MELDLDARLAARGEVTLEDHEITWKSEKWKIPARIPWAINVHLSHGRTNSAMEMLLGEEQWGAMTEGCDLDEVRILVGGILEVVGLAPGESSASSSSSPSTGARSRRTSSGSTGSTSAKRSTGKR